MLDNVDLDLSNFDWGEVYDPSYFIGREIFVEKVYDFWEQVKEGDIVLDVGSSVGPFAYKALTKKCKKIYCVEPSRALIQTNIKNNSKFFIDSVENPVVFVNYAISDKTENEFKNSSDLEIEVYGSDKNCKTITFGDLIEKYKIQTIDFLKIDCEGGEYSILNENYVDFIKNNVNFIACEVHARTIENGYEKFLSLKNNFLSKLPRESYKIMCNVDNVYTDITDYVFTDNGMNYVLPLAEVMLYIKKL